MKENKDGKTEYTEVKSKVKFKVVKNKDGEKGEEAIITVPSDIVKNFSKAERDSLTAAVIANSEKEKEEDKGEKKFKKKGLILIPLVVMLPLIMHSCGENMKTSGEEVKTIIETQEISGTHYQTDYIEEHLGALTNYAGQEQMTQSALEGENIFADENSVYSADEQFEAETKSSENIEKSKDIREQIQQNLEILTGENASQEQIYNAAKQIKELNEKIDSEYKLHEDFAQEEASKFQEASEAHKDSNTENEIAVVNEILNDYKSQLGLTENNIDVMNDIIECYENGYEIDIEGTANLKGDWEIDGQAIREVVVEQEQSGIKGAWNNFKDFITGKDQNKETER